MKLKRNLRSSRKVRTNQHKSRTKHKEVRQIGGGLEGALGYVQAWKGAISANVSKATLKALWDGFYKDYGSTLTGQAYEMLKADDPYGVRLEGEGMEADAKVALNYVRTIEAQLKHSLGQRRYKGRRHKKTKKPKKPKKPKKTK
jgi:hypothetical protein